MTDETNALMISDDAEKMLAEIQTIDDAKHFIGLAEAARRYVKLIGGAQERQNYYAELKARGEWKAGGVLYEMRKKGQLVKHGQNRDSENSISTYGSLGIDMHDGPRWSAYYKIPEAIFLDGIQKIKSENKELNTYRLYIWVKSYGKPPKDTAGEKKPVPPFVEIKDALATIKENVSILDAAAKRGDKVADHHLRMLCMALTDLVTDLIEKGYTYEQAATVLETS